VVFSVLVLNPTHSVGFELCGQGISHCRRHHSNLSPSRDEVRNLARAYRAATDYETFGTSNIQSDREKPQVTLRPSVSPSDRPPEYR
jgi:hypothetical protein